MKDYANEVIAIVGTINDLEEALAIVKDLYRLDGSLSSSIEEEIEAQWEALEDIYSEVNTELLKNKDIKPNTDKFYEYIFENEIEYEIGGGHSLMLTEPEIEEIENIIGLG
jgi:2-hydroxy-3-keto-5-methylthiopentenyl-1-phosphate phosphatase